MVFLWAAGEVKVISQLRAQLVPAPNCHTFCVVAECECSAAQKSDWPGRQEGSSRIHVDFEVDGAGAGVVGRVHLAPGAAQAEVGRLAVTESILALAAACSVQEMSSKKPRMVCMSDKAGASGAVSWQGQESSPLHWRKQRFSSTSHFFPCISRASSTNWALLLCHGFHSSIAASSQIHPGSAQPQQRPAAASGPCNHSRCILGSRCSAVCPPPPWSIGRACCTFGGIVTTAAPLGCRPKTRAQRCIEKAAARGT